jgi:hypothetical protein
MGKCPSPLSRGACYTLASVRCLPLSKHTVGGGTTPAFSGWLVYLQFVQESAPSPLQWSFSHDSHCYKLSLLQGCWVGATTPAFSGQLVYLQFCEGVPLPHSPELRAPRRLCYVSFFFLFQLLVYYSVFFFSFFPGWGSVCPGGCANLAQVCLWEYRVPLSSPGGLLLPSQVGAGIWWCGSPPGFSI